MRCVNAQGANADVFSHEAGFDAWMTGASFARLLTLHAAEAAAAAGAPQAPLSDAPAVTAAEYAAAVLEGGPAVEDVLAMDLEELLVEPEPRISAVAEFSGRLSLSWCVLWAFLGTPPPRSQSLYLYDLV